MPGNKGSKQLHDNYCRAWYAGHIEAMSCRALRAWVAIYALSMHCPKLLKLSRDILRSVDATKLNEAELLGLFFRITFWTVLYFFVNDLRNILRTSLGFSSDSKCVSSWIRTYNLLNRKVPLYPLGHCCTWLEKFTYNKDISYLPSAVTKEHYPHYIAGVLEHLRM